MWVKLDDGFARNPKVAGLSDKAFRLHVAALCHAGMYLTDGHIGHDLTRPSRYTRELETAQLWHPNGTGWLIHDWDEFNDPAEMVRKRRAADAERKRRQRRDERGRFEAPPP